MSAVSIPGAGEVREEDAFDVEAVRTWLARQGQPLTGDVTVRQFGGGASNLTRLALDFPDTVHPVLEALEEQVVLIRLLGEASRPSELTVRIGDENAYEGLRSTSVVSATYGSGSRALASLGVLGPMRMDYPGTMAAVSAVARYVGRILAES